MDDYVYLRVKRKNAKYQRHKLTPVVEGPSKATEVDTKTVVIEKTDQSGEDVSRSRVVLAGNPQTNQDVFRCSGFRLLVIPMYIITTQSRYQEIKFLSSCLTVSLYSTLLFITK